MFKKWGNARNWRCAGHHGYLVILNALPMTQVVLLANRHWEWAIYTKGLLGSMLRMNVQGSETGRSWTGMQSLQGPQLWHYPPESSGAGRPFRAVPPWDNGGEGGARTLSEATLLVPEEGLSWDPLAAAEDPLVLKWACHSNHYTLWSRNSPLDPLSKEALR